MRTFMAFILVRLSKGMSFADRRLTTSTASMSSKLTTKLETFESKCKLEMTSLVSFSKDIMEQLPTLTERDFILTWNLMPSDYTEAVTLVPSLKALDQEKVTKMVNYLNDKRGLGHGGM